MRIQAGGPDNVITRQPVPVSVLVAATLLAFAAVTLFLFQGQIDISAVSALREGEGDAETLQEQSGSRSTGSLLSEEGARAMLPYYMECIHTPAFTIGDATGACNVLHTPNGTFRQPRDVFKQMDMVHVDVSRCRGFVEAMAPTRISKAALAPFDVHLRPNSTDHRVILQVYCGTGFGFIKALANYMPLDKPLTYLDAGSNIGCASVLFAHSLMGRGQIVAVEANPDTFKVMKRNHANFSGMIVPVQAAIVDSVTAAEKEHLTFKGSGKEYWGFSVDHDGTEARGKDPVTLEVPTASLASLRDMTKAKHFDLIKLDIEGEEKYLLEDAGSRAVLCEATCIFMELHERLVEGCDAAFEEFLAEGCDGEQFKKVSRTGEYTVICRSSDGWLEQ